MTKDKQALYLISIGAFAVFLAIFLVSDQYTKLITALFSVVLAVAIRLTVKKRSSLSINKREVLLLLTILGVLYVILLHMSGLYFGFYKNPYFITFRLFFLAVLPIVAIIFATETIRSTLLAQKNAVVSVIAFLSCVIAEVLISSSLASVTNFNNFMDMVGLSIFPALSANVFYHFTSRRFGSIPNIVFRLIVTLYVYFFPTVTAMPDALLSCIRIFLPIILLAFTSALFEKKKKNAIRRGNKLTAIGLTASVLLTATVAMLVSCQFRFGALVIATESMTGEMNKGDVVIYEQYDNQPIKEGQVIVFLQNDNTIIHRVVRIENTAEEVRYYTKGDANDAEDSGYRVKEDIVGVTDMKIAYLGYPTLLLRELLTPKS